MSSSEEEFDGYLKIQFHKIQRGRQGLEREELKLGFLENRDDGLEPIRSIRSGEVCPTSIYIYRHTFQDKI